MITKPDKPDTSLPIDDLAELERLFLEMREAIEDGLRVIERQRRKQKDRADGN